ncbi:MAG: hypothetical protein ACT4NY_20850 [Pseudonocardiales bacterium]
MKQPRAAPVKLHSEIDSYRRVFTFRTPLGEPATVIVMRRRNTVWLTFNGAAKTTVVMRDFFEIRMAATLCGRPHFTPHGEREALPDLAPNGARRGAVLTGPSQDR